ncbi:MAG: arylsulfatase [Bryobacteraceae bacterium]
MERRHVLTSLAGGLASAGGLLAANGRRPKRIVLLYADDVGYGDFSCYGAQRVRTPNIDRLAAGGVRFTDAHCSAATCTPSRFSLLTGTYSFRVPAAKVLPGDASLLIEPGSVTLPSILKRQGYRTSVVGKWHLGLGRGPIDWNKEIRPGPLDIGFDESFIIPATGDRVPCVYVEDRRVRGLDPADPIQVSYRGPLDDSPTGKTHPELLRMTPSHGHDMTIVNGISRIGYMTGGKSALWNDDEMADTLTNRAVSFIEANRARDFFLYFASHDIHVPRVPNRRFRDATVMGPRGNAIAEFDWSVGRILETIDRHGLRNDTLVIVSSDNGAVIDDGYNDEAVPLLGSHRPNGPFRGGKYSNFEGGTRVPFIVNWPARIRRGSVSSALVGQLDLVRSLADLTGAKLPADAVPDSENVLPALLGETKSGRKRLVEQASSLSLREGDWKYIRPLKGNPSAVNAGNETGSSTEAQLYDLTSDPGEAKNLAADDAGRVARMESALEAIRSGRV